MDRYLTTTRWIVASLVWSALVSALLLVVPASTRETCTVSPGSDPGCVSQHLSLLESEGVSVLPILLVPIAIPLVALIVRRPPRVLLLGLGVLYLLLVAAAIASIGAFYAPGATALLLAGVMAGGRTARPQDGAQQA